MITVQKTQEMESGARWDRRWCALQSKHDGVVEYVWGELLAWKKLLMQSLQNKQNTFRVKSK